MIPLELSQIQFRFFFYFDLGTSEDVVSFCFSSKSVTTLQEVPLELCIFLE